MREIPPAWAQSCPHAVRLAPEGLLVPAATLRFLLGRGGAQELIVTGYGFEPWIRDGDRMRVEPEAAPRPGDIVLCDVCGWGELRRVLRAPARAGALTGVDVVPGARDIVPVSRILGAVRGTRGAGGALGRLVARFYPTWTRLAAFLSWRRRILAAPAFGDGADTSVRKKYEEQVAGYCAQLDVGLGPDLLDHLRRRLAPGAAVLVVGCGAGGELIDLARAGYAAAGVDFVPQMIEACRKNLQAAGLDADLFEGDMVTLDLVGRRFDAIYVTPCVYSLVAGRERRITALRRLGEHLRPGGAVIFSPRLIKSPVRFLELALAWSRLRGVAASMEFGDWHTRFLTPRGTLGTSFLHLTTRRQVASEVRRAGFGRLEVIGRGHFAAEKCDG